MRLVSVYPQYQSSRAPVVLRMITVIDKPSPAAAKTRTKQTEIL